ncbi:MAG: hypothetical protein RIQ71_607 [Verrucomicrobiota bacterium]|jgi:hypothetical protein
MSAKRPAQRRLFSWEASCGNWRWQGKYPANTDPDLIVLRAMLALRGLAASADRLTKLPAKRKSGYLVDPTINLLTPDKGTVRIETASAIELAEQLEQQAVDRLRKQRVMKKIAELGKGQLLDI